MAAAMQAASTALAFLTAPSADKLRARSMPLSYAGRKASALVIRSEGRIPGARRGESLITNVVAASPEAPASSAGSKPGHQKYVLNVKHAAFHTQKTGRKRVIISTEENVIASLDLWRGEIFWRHVLGRNDPVDHIDVTLGKFKSL